LQTKVEICFDKKLIKYTANKNKKMDHEFTLCVAIKIYGCHIRFGCVLKFEKLHLMLLVAKGGSLARPPWYILDGSKKHKRLIGM